MSLGLQEPVILVEPGKTDIIHLSEGCLIFIPLYEYILIFGIHPFILLFSTTKLNQNRKHLKEDFKKKFKES